MSVEELDEEYPSLDKKKDEEFFLKVKNLLEERQVRCKSENELQNFRKHFQKKFSSKIEKYRDVWKKSKVETPQTQVEIHDEGEREEIRLSDITPDVIVYVIFKFIVLQPQNTIEYSYRLEEFDCFGYFPNTGRKIVQIFRNFHFSTICNGDFRKTHVGKWMRNFTYFSEHDYEVLPYNFQIDMGKVEYFSSELTPLYVKKFKKFQFFHLRFLSLKIRPELLKFVNEKFFVDNFFPSLAKLYLVISSDQANFRETYMNLGENWDFQKLEVLFLQSDHYYSNDVPKLVYPTKKKHPALKELHMRRIHYSTDLKLDTLTKLSLGGRSKYWYTKSTKDVEIMFGQQYVDKLKVQFSQLECLKLHTCRIVEDGTSTTFENLRMLELNQVEFFGDPQLFVINSFPKLEKLHVYSTKFLLQRRSKEKWKQLPSLKHVNISFCEHFYKPFFEENVLTDKVEEIFIFGESIQLAPMWRKFVNLKRLDVRNALISDAFFGGQDFRKLKQLSLSQTKETIEIDLRMSEWNKYENLSSLYLEKLDISEKVFEESNFPNLKELSLCNLEIKGGKWKKFPKLERIVILDCNNFQDSFFQNDDLDNAKVVIVRNSKGLRGNGWKILEKFNVIVHRELKGILKIFEKIYRHYGNDDTFVLPELKPLKEPETKLETFIVENCINFSEKISYSAFNEWKKYKNKRKKFSQKSMKEIWKKSNKNVLSFVESMKKLQKLFE